MVTQEIIKTLYCVFEKSNGVSTDTRSIKKKEIFFALSGPNFNANAFIAEALKKKASYIVTEDESKKGLPQHLYVDNCLEALQKLATYHRKKFKIPIIAITGSNGKTTTKDLIALLLSQDYKTHATQGNLNNHIGVPLTLLRMSKRTKIGIIEMGANKQGDIKELCEIARPNHGLITNIGYAHTKGFGGFQGVIKGKKELYDYIISVGGRIFVNSADDILFPLVKDYGKLYTYPQPNDYFSLKIQDLDPFLVVNDERNIIHTKLVGSYNFSNVAAALCIAEFFGIKDQKSKNILQKYTPKNNRSQLINTAHNILILDAYNANPSSMAAALENLHKIPMNRKGVILGDMLELENEKKEHQKLGQKIAAQSDKYKMVVFIGKLMREAHQCCPNSLWYEDVEQAYKAFENKEIIKKCTILIKGSRLMTLEKLVAVL